jgi:hypothetical protein
MSERRITDSSYDVLIDPTIQALIAEAEADTDVIGLVVTGSRAVGTVTAESDYDIVFVVTDAALDRYTAHGAPVRGATLASPIDTTDLWHAAPRTLHLDVVAPWMLPAWAEARVVYDRTGETARVLGALRRMPAEAAHAAVTAWYDTYLNGLYRSLKAWRRGDTLGGRLEAAQTADALLHLLFALEGRWRPYSSRLSLHLAALTGQGWQPDELRTVLLTLVATGDPAQQQQVARRVVGLLRERGFHAVYEGWEGKIDQALAWRFA